MKNACSWLAAFLGAFALVGSAVSAGCSDSSSVTPIVLGPGSSGGSGGSSGGGGGGGPGDLCAGIANCTQLSPTMTEDSIKTRFILATDTPNTTLVFEPGEYHFRTQLSLKMAKGVTVRGAGREQTVLDFKPGGGAGGGAGAGGAPGGEGESEALDVSDSDDVVIEKLSVRDSVGDAIKVLKGTRVTFREVGVSWTDPVGEKHGAYGLYPVESKDVLIEKCDVSGASDAGIYVGQSERVVVRNNTVHKNVAGIEIENTISADVYENTAEGNTGGILVFSLPQLSIANGKGARIYNNTIRANNERNFAPAGNVVGMVPAGTGAFVMASQDVEFFDNKFIDNKTAQYGIISFLATLEGGQAPPPAPYDVYPARVYAHDNTFEGGGTAPDVLTKFGSLFVGGMNFDPPKLPTPLPALLFDGLVPPGGQAEENPTQLCFKNNVRAMTTEAVPFANLHLETVNPNDLSTWQPVVSAAGPQAPYDCTLPPQPAVTIPQLAATP